MPRRPLFLLLGILLLLVLVGWLMLPGYRRQQAVARQLTQAANTSPADAARNAERAAPPESTFPLNSPAHDIQADLKLLGETIDTFRSNFPQEGNPIGTNAEITAALAGKNKVRFAFIPSNHPAINRDGELCDRWGTPFYFHAESATRMEIRSAGPDKKMWSDDDIAFAP